jgi:hypothetical protein
MNVSFLRLFIILVTQVEIEWVGVDTSKPSHVIIRIQGHGIFGKEM